jgi:hypothetical protein
MVEHVPVKSSAVASVGHDPEANELHVVYSTGSHYVYPNVSADQHAALMAAPSVGKHLNVLRKQLAAPRKAD